MQRLRASAATNAANTICEKQVALLVFAVFLFSAPPAQAALPAAQRTALADLYNTTNGASWTTKTNWLGAADECTWYGVTCNAGHTAVEQLVLESNNLNGPLPASLSNLTALRVLILSANNLTGSIPSQLGTLTSMNGSLALNNNRLSGSIPAELGNLTNLQQLVLHDNQLSGSIPSQLGNLTSLLTLILADNQLTGSIPSTLGNLTNLQSLTLMNNQLSGSIPSQLGSLSNVTQVWLTNNQLSGSIPSQLGSLNKLEYLVLSKNRLSGSVPSQLGNLAALQYLWLQSNQLSGSIPATLRGLTNLASCFIEFNALFSTDPQLTSFLTARQNSNFGDWQNSQTIAPANLSISNATPSSITVNWTPIAYSGNNGSYQIRYSTTAGGPYTTFATTASGKAASSLIVTGLAANKRYYFVVSTSTQPHSFNGNTVVSGLSAEVSGLTSGGGPAAPVANFSWSPPSPQSGQQVQFTDASTGTPTSWSWTFGDGTTTSSQSPSHVFTANGTYSVKLTATNAGGSSSKTRDVAVAAASSAPIAKFNWSPALPKAGEEVQFSDTSTGPPTSWSWVFGDGSTSTSRNPKHTFVAVGTYAVKLTAASTSGSDSLTRNITVASGPCPHAGWSDLKFATSAIGKELEAFHGDIPDPHPTLYEMITDSLDKRVRDLKAQILAAAPNTVFTRLSGYRPPDYQDHLYQLKKLYEAMYKVRGSITAVQCASEIAKVEDEKSFHKLGPQKPGGVEIPGTLAVNKRSNHEYRNALDVSVIPTPGDWAAAVRLNNLLEPCSERAVHLQTKENPVCGASTTVTALAFVQAGTVGIITGSSVPLVPIRLLIRDPAGRRVGYDAVTGAAVNEIGATATYSGVDSDPQVITVEDAVGGDYHVDAVAVSSGAYTLMLSADDEEHGSNFGSRSTTGNAVVGNPIEPLGLGVQQTTPQFPGRRRVVRH